MQMNIVFESSHGSRALTAPSQDCTLRDVISWHSLPAGAITIYGKKLTGETVLLPALLVPIRHLAQEYSKLIVRPDRNIDYDSLLCRQIKWKQRPTQGVAEYSYTSDDAKQINHVEFTQDECQAYVNHEVEDFLEEFVPELSGGKVIVGVSGGGDSNTLVESLLSSDRLKPSQIIAVMMLGIPDWDKGKDRAATLCEKYDVELKFVNSQTVNRLLGRSEGSDWVEDFEKTYPGTDMEVIGTLAIRLALVHVAKQEGAQNIVIGLNLEDLLSECLLRTMQGRLPLKFPIRRMDGANFWYPLYKVPKRILDGCHPKFSLANYLNRYPSVMMGRTIPYYIGQMIHHISPGSEFDLLCGYQKIANEQNTTTSLDEELKIETFDEVPDTVKSKWLLFTQQ